jgi:hypothetical protein
MHIQYKLYKEYNIITIIMFQEDKKKLYVAEQQRYRVSTNYHHYISFKKSDGTLDYKLIPNYTIKYV